MPGADEIAAVLADNRDKTVPVREFLGKHPGITAAQYLEHLQRLPPKVHELKQLVDGGMKLEEAILEVEGLSEADIREYLASVKNPIVPEAKPPSRGRRNNTSSPTPRSQGVHHGSALPRGSVAEDLDDPTGSAIRKRLTTR